jgi:type IV pilus assembly protein PilC
MPVYTYTAIDQLGRKLSGKRDAASEALLESSLKEEGQWLVKARFNTFALFAERRRRNAKVPRRHLIEFFLQTHIQLKAGIPIFTALGFGAAECGDPLFRAVQQELLDRVEAGEFLSDAMAVYPRLFPPLVTNLMRAGEMSGRLA